MFVLHTAMKTPPSTVSTLSSHTNPPTVRELAAELGLHHATVARALGNQPNVSATTRERVLAAAGRSGYRANALVNALMAQVRQRHRLKPTGEVVAFLTGFDDEHAWRRFPSVCNQFEGASERAAELGFNLQPVWLGHHGEQARQMARVLHARGVRGSLLASGVSGDDGPLALDWQNHASVAIGYGFRQVPLHRAVHDSVNLIATCYARLRAAGCRRIGLAIAERYGARGRYLWVTGYLGAQWRHGDAVLPPFLFDDDADTTASAAAFSRWLAEHDPDAVIGLWPDRPLAWLRAQRIRVPDRVSYATLDLGEHAGQLAGMEQDNHTIGVAAMDLLASQLFRNDIGIPKIPTVTLVEGIWRDGPTARMPAITRAATPPRRAARPRGGRRR